MQSSRREALPWQNSTVAKRHLPRPLTRTHNDTHRHTHTERRSRQAATKPREQNPTATQEAETSAAHRQSPPNVREAARVLRDAGTRARSIGAEERGPTKLVGVAAESVPVQTLPPPPQTPSGKSWCRFVCTTQSPPHLRLRAYAAHSRTRKMSQRYLSQSPPKQTPSAPHPAVASPKRYQTTTTNLVLGSNTSSFQVSAPSALYTKRHSVFVRVRAPTCCRNHQMSSRLSFAKTTHKQANPYRHLLSPDSWFMNSIPITSQIQFTNSFTITSRIHQSHEVLHHRITSASEFTKSFPVTSRLLPSS